jgi:uncharacterized protein (TIGR03083 family)
MPAATDRDTLVAALREQFDSLIELGRQLDEGQWSTASECPGWRVKDLYSHVIGTELMLLGRPDEGDPDDLGDVADHVANEIGRFNEVAVARRRDLPGAEVLAELEQVAAERLAALDAMTQADFDAESFTPAGKDTYGRFMQIRVFDCWIHEQDAREPLGLPGHAGGRAVDVAVDEHATALGFVVGKKAGAADGQSVRLHLTGPTERTLDVRVDGRARLVDDLESPTATITIPTLLWFRYAAGRRPADAGHPDVVLEGDEDLAHRVLANAAYTI